MRCPKLLLGATVILAAPVASDGAQAPLNPHPSSASLGQNPFRPQFDKYIEGLLDEWKVAGLAIGVVDAQRSYAKASASLRMPSSCDANTHVNKAYGYAQLPDVPATTDTLWYVGSTTKAQVTAVLAQMIDNQTHPALSRGWQTPISSIIRDDFVLADDWATAHLTLEDAASHRTGLSGHIDALPSTLGNGVAPATPGDITRLLRHLPLSHAPRTRWEYNNFMYVALSHAVEALTGEPLRETLRRALWAPLGMASTFLNLRDVDRAARHRVARGYYWDRARGTFGEHPLWDAPGIGGAGTELSTVEDYVKWLACLIDRAAALSAAAHADIRAPRTVVPPEAYPPQGLDISMYGLAWFRTAIHGHVAYMHTGSTETHGANVAWLPELGYGLVIFLNRASEIRHVIARKLIEDRIGTPEADRFDVSEYWRKLLAAGEEAVDNAVDALFPERPTPALPSTHAPAALVGSYHHPGYGTLDLCLDSASGSEDASRGRPVLVADRKNLAFPVQWRFEHVSGDYWVVWRYGLVDTARPNAAYAARVETAVSGAVASIVVQLSEQGLGEGPLEIIFSRQK
ncbi:Beta-lactamase/transpeptidase-like protein [Cordyceps fumosorosea ARSEF 2679]|uniref:Beta-lactamase/transpeptidase-like protein n=1 Tax=Cordyceps fumosorosea (strain ARSEF 2679) TaxID=1081104 RepID=A0A168BU61_CORFA|nr:Beta-lactamase/transpeptidase-like protein [Cordyceps fumosorosea ARSEF 2679]OAA70555.1 Beta-lactamase/transpeptidase-like protein [Cordyceps fumosorosea ARSEF 2679]